MIRKAASLRINFRIRIFAASKEKWVMNMTEKSGLPEKEL